MKFLNQDHEIRYKSLIRKDMTSDYDFEKIAMFYILSGNTDIWNKGIEKFYDFTEHGITPDKLKKIDLCTSSKALINLAYQPYVGNNKYTINDIFKSLNADNAQLAFNAIEIRYFGLK